MSHRNWPAERARDQRIFQTAAFEINHHPAYRHAYTGPLPKKEQKKLVNTPLTEAFTPDERAYLRAHRLRRQVSDHVKGLARQEVVRLAGPSPSDQDELDWSSQQSWANYVSDRLEEEVASPRFAAEMAKQIGQRTGHVLHPAAERFLARPQQPHLYARAGALMLAGTFGDRSFHRMKVEDTFDSLRPDYARAVQGLLEDDGVMIRDGHHASLNLDAVRHLSMQPVYLPPPHIPANR